MKHVVLLKSKAGNSGGLEKYASRIAAAFTAKGARVSILTTGSTPQNNPSIYTFPTAAWPAFLRMEQFDRAVTRWLKKNHADLVFGMDRNRFQTHIRAGNGVHAAYLESRVHTEGWVKKWTCMLNPLHIKILQLEKQAFENPLLQKLFTNSYMVRDQILQRFQTDPKKIQVIHNGVEWHEMQADFSAWTEQKRSDLFQFLFIGNGYLRKGLDRLLEGLARLKRRDFQLSVIGKDNKIDEYRAKTIRLGLDKQVFFFGAQTDIRPFYQTADVLVIPSFYDPFANVTVEALAMGLFVVSSKQNGGHEILTAENGTVIEDLLNTDSVVNALEIAMKHPKTPLSAELARQSVKHLDFSHQLTTLVEACE